MANPNRLNLLEGDLHILYLKLAGGPNHEPLTFREVAKLMNRDVKRIYSAYRRAIKTVGDLSTLKRTKGFTSVGN